MREVGLQCCKAVVVGLHQLTDQVFHQVELVQPHPHHRPGVVQGHAVKQVEQRTFLEEFAGEGREGPEQNHALAVEHAGIKMRYRHGWRAAGGDAIGLGHVAQRDVLVLGDQERATDREACIVVGLGNARLLQQRQGCAACTDEHELGVGGALAAILQVLVRDVPGTVFITGDVFHLGGQLEVERLTRFQVADVLPRNLPPVDVGADGRPGDRQLLLRVAPFHHQRHPLGDLRRVFGVLHRAEQRARLQRLKAFLEEANVVVTPHEAHMRGTVDEGMGVFQHALLDLPGQELTGDLEGFVDLHRFGDVDLTVFFRGVVQFGQGRVAGTGVVPAVRAFFGNFVQALDQLHRPAWLQFIQPHSQGRTHDAAADQQYVDFLRCLGIRCLGGTRAEGQAEPRRRQCAFDPGVHVPLP